MATAYRKHHYGGQHLTGTRFMQGTMAHGMLLGSLLVCVRSWVVAGLLTDLGVNRIFLDFEIFLNEGSWEARFLHGN
jgi:hypothetical protein